MPDSIIIIFQIFTYFVLCPPLRIFYKIETSYPSNFWELKKGSLLIANHQSMADPFIVLSRIPFGIFCRIVPIRFPVLPEYAEKIYLSKVLRLLGCYNIGRTKRENMMGLVYTRRLLKNGKTVFLFPEGRISREGNKINEFKKGVEFFLKDTQNTIFIKMQGFNKFKILSFGERCRIVFGPVQDLRRQKVNAEDLKMVFEDL